MILPGDAAYTGRETVGEVKGPTQRPPEKKNQPTLKVVNDTPQMNTGAGVQRAKVTW